MGVIIELLKKPIVMLGAVIFVSAVAAIIFERAINDLILNYMHPISVLGLAIVVLGMVPILASMDRLRVHSWFVILIGVGFITIGYILGVG